VKAPVLVASGITPDNLPLLERAHGVIVGSWLMKDGRAGGPVDADRATRFADAFRSRR
jgi:predicted TIM-barrel enzyme